jgi:hypothetical protein
MGMVCGIFATSLGNGPVYEHMQFAGVMQKPL